LKHASQVSSCWPYAHDKFEDEVFTENAQDWDEVVARMVDPKMTRFKAMSLDEQETTLEQSAQGALRAREERIASEATKQKRSPLDSPNARQRYPFGIGRMGKGTAHVRMGATGA
jgi:hypothetical protein